MRKEDDESLEEDYVTTKASCRTIIDYIAQRVPVINLFDTDDHISVLCQNFILTFDYDVGYCRIHTNQWKLEAAIDIAKYPTEICSKMILDFLL